MAGRGYNATYCFESFKPSVLVNEDGCGTRVEKAGYNWLCQLVMLGGYDDGLRQLGDGLR